MNKKVFVLGAGITGLSAGISTKNRIYEARQLPGGICASYYMNAHGEKTYLRQNEESYRFEIGGGHWIFGADDLVLRFIKNLSPVKKYKRNSAVYFSDRNLYVPYPLQNHLNYLPKNIAQKALKEIMQADHGKPVIFMSQWLERHFGNTMCELFFFPYHALYTAGLFTKIEPQDQYKTPLDIEHIIKGYAGKTPQVGYNATFVYPKAGLDDLIKRMAAKCNINYNKEVAAIDLKGKEVFFQDGGSSKYEALISSIPLNQVVKLAGIKTFATEPPYTSALVINIGAKKGIRCPNYHWLYVPKNKSGFHRVGFYSNVDNSFLPKSSRKDNNIVSLYVEKTYLPSKKPKRAALKKICKDIVTELKEWEFIADTEIIDPVWIETAYTWSYPDSDWKQKTTELLRQNHVCPVGRYGLWEFQGIAQSIRDGLVLPRNVTA
ncbi:MAG: FAD-dependent oxidoreductase [Candidatus Omnitrophota bacterium]